MDNGDQVQDENLVNDQVAQALNDSGISDPSAVSAAVDSSADAVAPTPTPTPTPTVTPTVEPVAAPVIPTVTPVEETPVTEPSATPASEPVAAGSGEDDELIGVKQKALEQLSPLVSHLDLPADQKFDTYMEIIRASDDKTLVQPAFDAAQAIEDEDKKAQALLDVVNEVNYLTQDSKDQAG